LVVFKPGATRPVTTATFKALTCFCLFGLWPKIQATRYAVGRWLGKNKEPNDIRSEC